MTRHIWRTMLAAVTVAALFAIPAQGAAQIAITSPVEGATVSRAAEPAITVAGTATLPDPVPAVRTFYLRRDACGGSTPNNPHLSIRPGGDGGDGCGNLASGVPTEVLATAGSRSGETVHPAVDGVPLVLDTTKAITGKLVMNGYAGNHAGLARVEVTLSGGGQAIGSQIVEQVLDPNQASYEFPFSITPPGAMAGKVLNGFTLAWRVRGATAAFGFLEMNGASLVNVPIIDSGLIEVSTASTFTAARTTGAALKEDGTWEAEIATPAAGARTIYARIVQAGQTVASATTNITVVP